MAGPIGIETVEGRALTCQGLLCVGFQVTMYNAWGAWSD